MCPLQVKRELTVLEKVRNISNVIRLVAPVRDQKGVPALIFEFEPHSEERYYAMSISEIKTFAKQLLLALEKIHSIGIMHRDIKRDNLRYDFKRMRVVSHK